MADQPMISATKNELSLFVFIDALGWEIFSEHGLCEQDWQTAGPLESVLGYSCTCDPTILTGEMPDRHRHFSFFFKQADASPFRWLTGLQWLPDRLINRGRVRHHLSKLIAKLHGYDGYFQLYETPFEVLPYFDYMEKRDIYQPGGILGGQPTVFDELRDRSLPFSLSDWRKGEPANFARLERDLRTERPGFAYLYLAGLDGILHAEGTTSPRVKEHIRWYEQQLGRILNVAESNYDAVRVYLFSDHGMTDVSSTIDIMARLAPLGLRFGKDYVAYFDSTMARFWFEHDQAANRIHACLAEAAGGHWLTQSELTDYRVDFDDKRYGESIFLCDPGVLIVPSFMGKKPLKGMHGYDPRHKDSLATFASTELIAQPPRRLDDLHGVMMNEICKASSAPRQLESAGARS